jgi:hypothetical protein
MIRWLVLGVLLPVAAAGFVLELWIFASLNWSSGGFWIYVALPAALLALSVGAAAVAFVATKRRRPAAVTLTIALLVSDVAAGLFLSQEPFLF